MGESTGLGCVQGQLSGATYWARVCPRSTEWGNLQGQCSRSIEGVTYRARVCSRSVEWWKHMGLCCVYYKRVLILQKVAIITKGY